MNSGLITACTMYSAALMPSFLGEILKVASKISGKSWNAPLPPPPPLPNLAIHPNGVGGEGRGGTPGRILKIVTALSIVIVHKIYNMNSGFVTG